MEIRERDTPEISAELQAETWENIPELDPRLVDAALNRLETLVLQFDDDVEEVGRKKGWLAKALGVSIDKLVNK